MCGLRQPFLQCGAETPKGRTPLVCTAFNNLWLLLCGPSSFSRGEPLRTPGSEIMCDHSLIHSFTHSLIRSSSQHLSEQEARRAARVASPGVGAPTGSAKLRVPVPRVAGGSDAAMNAHPGVKLPCRRALPGCPDGRKVTSGGPGEQRWGHSLKAGGAARQRGGKTRRRRHTGKKGLGPKESRHSPGPKVPGGGQRVLTRAEKSCVLASVRGHRRPGQGHTPRPMGMPPTLQRGGAGREPSLRADTPAPRWLCAEGRTPAGSGTVRVLGPGAELQRQGVWEERGASRPGQCSRRPSGGRKSWWWADSGTPSDGSYLPRKMRGRSPQGVCGVGVGGSVGVERTGSGRWCDRAVLGKKRHMEERHRVGCPGRLAELRTQVVPLRRDSSTVAGPVLGCSPEKGESG